METDDAKAEALEKKEDWGWLGQFQKLSPLFAFVSLLVSCLSFWLSLQTFTMSQENVLFQANGFSGGRLDTFDQVKWPGKFIVSNAAAIDLSITSLHCSNYQNEPWKATTYRPCEILQPKSVPFILKAGDSIVVYVEKTLTPKGSARIILSTLKKQKPKATIEDYEEALTNENMTVDGMPLYEKPRKKKEKFYSFGASMSGGSKLGLLDIFKETKQGIILYIRTGRGNDVASPFYEIYLPDPAEG